MSTSTVAAQEAAATPDAPIVDAEVVDEAAPERPTPIAPAAGTDLARQSGSAATPTLFRDYGDDPAQMMAVAERFATSFNDVLKSQKLTSRIGNKDHVDIEGWQTVGRLAGVAVQVTSRVVCHPVTGEPLVTKYDVHVKDYEWVHPEGGGKKVRQLKAERDYTVEGHDWEATATAILPDGTLVGSSDAMCSRTEDKWAKDDDTALRGMAQTRASSRAYRAALGWVVHMAGYSGTPTEEMDGVVNRHPHNQEADQDLKNLASAALIELAGGVDQGRAVWAQMKEDMGGAMPVCVCQAIVATGLAVAAKNTPAADDKDGRQAEQAPTPDEPVAAGEVANGEQILAIGKAFDEFDAPLNVRKAVLTTVAGAAKPAQVPVGLVDGVLALIGKIAAEAPDQPDAVFKCLQALHQKHDRKPLGSNVGPALDAIHDLNVPF